MRISLEIPEDASPAYRARIGYAFRLFCAIYGHQPLVDADKAATRDLTICYDRPSVRASTVDGSIVRLGRGYRARNLREPSPPPVKYACGGVNTLLHYAPTEGDPPDWLGEIFEWVSCADEYSVTERDSAGRPLFAATYAGRHRIDTQIPYAAVAMHCLQQEICRVSPRVGDRPSGLDGTGAHLVVPTHDVDYFPAGRLHAVKRLTRNAMISCLLAGSPSLGMRQALLAARVALGGRADPLDRIVELAEEERRLGIGASYNFLVRHGHHRDASYTLEHAGVLKVMRWLELRGIEVGLHGSYTSLDDPGGLEREVACLNARGFCPRGGRQHWLRYTLDRLIPAVQRAGLQYDTSIGWSERIGFRAGACFAFPPYDFEKEGAAAFLEIPLVMMEQALQMQYGDAEQMFGVACDVLATSRRFGWGGISLLWHPAAFGNGWLAPDVGDIFWSLAHGRAGWNDRWVSASDFLEATRLRYVEAGLLSPENRSIPEPMPVQEPVQKVAGAVARAKRGALQGNQIKPPEDLVGA